MILAGGEFGLIFAADLEGVEDARKGGLGADADDGVLVEEVVDPWDLRNLGEAGGSAGARGFDAARWHTGAK